MSKLKYTAIAEVSEAIVELIKKNVVPDIIPKADLIGLCSPAANGDFLLGVYLYSIEESEKFRLSGRQNTQLYYQKYPPIVLDLYYMVTPYYKSDVKFCARQEQIILGKVVQIINDNSSIFANSGQPVELEFINPSLDDRQKIWNGNSAYKTSLFICARAVIVESSKVKKVSRVTDISVQTDVMEDAAGAYKS